MKKFWFALAALAVAVGCQEERSISESTSPARFLASFAEEEDGTRTYVDGEGENVRLHWTAGDKIAIFHSTYGEEYVFQGETGDRGGAFDKVASSQFTAGFELSRNYAVYPYAAGLRMEDEGKVTVTLPATQPYAEGSFGLGAGLMTAVTSDAEDTQLTFKNVTGYLKLKVYGGVAVRSVSFQGNAHEKLTGSAEITIPYGDVPSIVVTGDGEEVTLDCGSVMTSEDPAAPTTFWFALPPKNFEQGFTVTVTDVNGLVTTKKVNRAIEIKRNVITPMAAFQLQGQTPQPPEPPTPEIPDDLPGWPYDNSRLPVLYVYTPDNVPVTTKEDWVSGSNAYLRVPDGTTEGQVTALGTANIRLRGNTTLNYDKKAYALKLDTKAGLLGMPSDKRWDLLANFVDRTRIRNHVALEMGRRVNGLAWTPKGQFVELYLNGVHMGNYYLVEHIKVGKKRVNITEMKAGDTDLSGGYLMEMGIEYDEPYQFSTEWFPDLYPGNRHFKANGQYHLPVMIKSPEDENMDNSKLQWIENHINEVQRSIVANDGAWHDEVDLDSFVDWMLVQEVVGNYEAFHPKSSFMYKDRGGKLFMGPLWDFDYGTFKSNYSMTPIYHYAIWYGYMMADPEFKARVRERWPAVKAAFESVAAQIPTNTTEAGAGWALGITMDVAVSQDRDWVKWGGASTSPKVNGDENQGIWVAYKAIKDNLLRRVNQFDTVEIPNNFQ